MHSHHPCVCLACACIATAKLLSHHVKAAAGNPHPEHAAADRCRQQCFHHQQPMMACRADGVAAVIGSPLPACIRSHVPSNCRECSSCGRAHLLLLCSAVTQPAPCLMEQQACIDCYKQNPNVSNNTAASSSPGRCCLGL